MPARGLAADLRDLLHALDLRDATLLGWSLGAPVIWSHRELFGRERVRDVVLVQQTPRQYFSADWKLGSPRLLRPGGPGDHRGPAHGRPGRLRPEKPPPAMPEANEPSALPSAFSVNEFTPQPWTFDTNSRG